MILLPSIAAQNYFKLIESPESSYFQRIAQFSNGDVLVSDIQKDLDPLTGQEEWLIELPANKVSWEDGNIDNSRTLFIPNTYSVTVEDCLTEKRFNSHLEKENCNCNTFISNIFSPNGDGFNDQLEVFSECAIESLKTTIFNRWGAIVFESTSTVKK